MDYSDFINKDIKCDCGVIHSSSIREIILKDNAIKELAGIIEKNNYKSIFIVADEKTWRAAGKPVLKSIEQAARGMDERKEIKITKHIFKEDRLLADEISIAKVFVHAPLEADLIIGIGTGTINDLCKLISKKLEKDYAIVVTAPSMDGFATGKSMLTLSCLKTPIITKQPDYIICDLKILCKSPKHMIASGVSSILEKYIMLTEWNLAELTDDGHYCRAVEKIIKKSIEAAEEAIKPHTDDGTNDFLLDRDIIKTIMESLLMEGIAISYIDNINLIMETGQSILSCLEMLLLKEGQPPIPYGTGIAIITVKLIKLCEKLLYEKLLYEKKLYGKLLCKKLKKGQPDLEEAEKRLKKLEENKDEVLSIINTLPSSDYIKDFLKALEIPYKAKHIGISKQLLDDSLFSGCTKSLLSL